MSLGRGGMPAKLAHVHIYLSRSVSTLPSRFYVQTCVLIVSNTDRFEFLIFDMLLLLTHL